MSWPSILTTRAGSEPEPTPGDRRRSLAPLHLAIAPVILGIVAIGLSGAVARGDSEYPRYESEHLRLRDGVRVAVDTWLPQELKAGQNVPTVVMFTRYWRLPRSRFGKDKPILVDVEALTRAGYALVYVDVRGTGASHGVWTAPWSDAEMDDVMQVFDWVSSQPWSNGRLATYGFSYQGTIQLLAAARGILRSRRWCRCAASGISTRT